MEKKKRTSKKVEKERESVETPRLPEKDTSSHYVDNKKFLAAMIGWKQQLADAAAAGKPKPGATEYIGDCFLQIATHLSYRPNFIAYSYRDEMISDGIENCLMYASNFDPAKSSNPFSYFTQIIYYAFLRRIQKEKKQTFIKYRCLDAADRHGRGQFSQWVKDEGLVDFESKNPVADYLRLTETDVANFEEKVKPKRKKKEKKPRKTKPKDEPRGLEEDFEE